MSNYRFILELYKGKRSRYTCPKCNKRGSFARYIDTETEEYLSPTVGRCNRESNCGYHYTPKQYFEINSDQADLLPRTFSHPALPPTQLEPSTIPFEIFKASLKGYEENHFIAYLQNLFGTNHTSQLISRYYIGTSKHWGGATVFWQIDMRGMIRAGKIMLYDPTTGKRVKKPYDFITWVHSALKIEDYHLQQCLFGEHLLAREPHKPVAIVESYKTAIIASGYISDYVWLATDNLGGLNTEKCQVLKGRKVLLYPDLKAYEKWSEKAKEFAGITSFTVSDLLEQKASEAERAEGLDIADYLIRHKVEPIHTPTLPKAALIREYYRYSFYELEAELGCEEAISKVKYYQNLSEQHKACESFIIHNCQLLITFNQSGSVAA